MPFPVPPEASRTFLCTPSLHDALPISSNRYPIQQRLLPRPTTFARRVPGLSLTSTPPDGEMGRPWIGRKERGVTEMNPDRKSTRLNSSHVAISYAVFCLQRRSTSGQRHLGRCPSLSLPKHRAPSSALLPYTTLFRSLPTATQSSNVCCPGPPHSLGAYQDFR